MALSSTPILALPDFTKEFTIQADASGSGLGAVLLQGGHPMAFFSKQMDPGQRATSAYGRELCGLVNAVQKWRPYLLGRKFTIETDHQPLKAILTQNIHTPEQQKWLVKLMGYEFDVRYKPGKDNVVADALSRVPEGSSHSMQGISKPELGVLRALRKYYSEDPDGLTMLQQIRDQPSTFPGHAIRDGLITFDNKLLVPPNNMLRDLILFEYHNTPSGAHPGRQRTLGRVSSNFTWDGLARDVKTHVDHSHTCKQVKAPNSAPAGLLQPLPIPSQVWQDISMDFITHLPTSKGFTAIMVVVDRFTKYAHFAPMKTGFTAEGVAQLFIREVARLHGFPRTIVSDRDPIFMSKFWREFFRLHQTNLSTSSAYHPESDGQTEIVNRALEDYLRSFVGDTQSDWASYLSWAEYSYNTSWHSSAGMTPFQAVYGRSPPSIIEFVPSDSTHAQVTTTLESRDHILQQLKTNIERAQLRMRQQANRHRTDKSFNIGDWVYIRLQPYRQNSVRNQRTSKLAKRFFGPFEVIATIGPVA
ncbi:unnamed protein product [Rhodiola kirilowii]